jgi:predicted alpha/beta hydrolase family esterase
VKSRDAEILIAPGFGGGLGPEGYAETIWYRRWCDRIATARIVEQANWDRPDRNLWTDALRREVAVADRPVILIGHSGGVMTIAHAFADAGRPDGIRGAFLVAPPEIRTVVGIIAGAESFDPRPTAPLPFPSMMIASRSDPYCAFDAATDMAFDWGSAIVDAGDCGHINRDSGHGPWPEGLMMFTRFISKL